jgi:transketolase
MIDLKQRILDLSYKNKLSHVGSSLTAVNAIEAIYELKKPEERFVLSNGHANLALQVVLKEHGLTDKESLETHADRTQKGVDCSTGSLGQGLPIAVGMALARMDQKVYCMISDGETSEGSIWEALRIASEQSLINLRIVVNSNGWGAYKRISGAELIDKFRSFGWGVIVVQDTIEDIKNALLQPTTYAPVMVIVDTNVDKYPFLQGQEGHYRIMTDADYGITKL